MYWNAVWGKYAADGFFDEYSQKYPDSLVSDRIFFGCI